MKQLLHLNPCSINKRKQHAMKPRSSKKKKLKTWSYSKKAKWSYTLRKLLTMIHFDDFLATHCAVKRMCIPTN